MTMSFSNAAAIYLFGLSYDLAGTYSVALHTGVALVAVSLLCLLMLSRKRATT